MTEIECCIWLQTVFGPGSPIPKHIQQDYGSIQNFYEAGGREWRLSGLLTADQVNKMEAADPAAACRIAAVCRRDGYRVIGISDPAYPQRLREIHSAPAVLYVNGAWPDFDGAAAIAMVGTRDATPYGLQVATRLASDLARSGVWVVSGGALGIDTAAHRAALMAGGRTVAVLGAGFHSRYLMSNAELRRQIAEKGVLVTEYPPDAPMRKGAFPLRNRIISALSLGVVVVEAGERSGALITAQHALEQGRDVFAVPGSVLNASSAGVNQMIQAGAKAVMSAADVLEEYRWSYNFPADSAAVRTEPVPHPPAAPTHRKSAPKPTPEPAAELAPEPIAIDRTALSPSAARLYDALTTAPQPIDQLTEAAGLTPRETLAAVTELEMLGALDAKPGKLYALK